jgi:uncharacterized protein (TIGR02145 family)
MYTPSGSLTYGLPHTGFTGGTGGTANGKWRTRWYNDNYGDTDISDVIFTYKIEEELSGGDGQPLIVNYPNVVFPVDANASDVYQSDVGGYIESPVINSEALSINVALNSSDLYSDIYERKLIVEDITGTTPLKVLEVDFYGEIVGEDERFNVLLKNLGRAFYQSDSIILRDHDPSEPLPNYLEINQKRKELLVAGEEIFPYVGSYKGLINALRFFGYQDLRIKEYWLNIDYSKTQITSPIQENHDFLEKIKADQVENGYSQSYQIADVIDNENSGKYKLTQTYGPDSDGNYVLDLSHEDTLLPTKAYKKTALFGLYYDLNKTTGQDDVYGYPEVVDAFAFTQEEVLIKIFALKERLKRDYLPLNARIIDITGEGIYFNIHNTRAWTDSMDRSDVNVGYQFEIRTNPDFGFLEDLRNFSLRPYQNAIQLPSNYNDQYSIGVSAKGGTGSALYFSGVSTSIDLLANPTFSVTSGKAYEFTMGSTGFDFFITTDPTLTTVIAPVGLTGNGATAGGSPLVWYVNPVQTSPVYYFSSQNKASLNGQITVLPSSVSDFGNTIEPLSNQQKFSPSQNSSMITAISNFYDLKQQGKIKDLGDGGYNYDSQVYIDPATGQPYQSPLGMPVILELIPDRWTWNEINVQWSSIILPIFAVGSRVTVKSPSNAYFGQSGNVLNVVSYLDETYSVQLDGGPTVTFDAYSLYAESQRYGLLTWENIDFSNMVEIEWIITKSPTQSGSPYNFVFRGPIVDFYKLSHFIPHTGDYKVTCNVTDGFNFKNTIIKDGAIKVSPKTIKMDAWTRYREVEDYDWSNVYKAWDDYPSIWEFPAEGSSIEVLSKTIPEEILNFSVYGNKAEEGQDVFVKVKSQPSAAYSNIVLTQTVLSVTDISSYLVSGSQYGFSTVTTSTAHGLTSGTIVSLKNTVPELSGRWTCTVKTSTTFEIPVVLQLGWDSVYTATSPARLTVDTSVVGYPDQKATFEGSISVSVENRVIGSAPAGDTLHATINSLVSSINGLRTYPDYFASCIDPTAIPATVKISAPTDLGADQNGIAVSVSTSGSLSVSSYDTGLTGGANVVSRYDYWPEYSLNFPNQNLRYWGTKRLNWETFETSTWDNGYAHGWYDFEYNNDWLGGYELHNISAGDKVLLSTANDSSPFPVGVTIQPGVSGLTLQELADQLNSSADRYVTNFYYRPIPNESGPLSTNTPPVNLSVSNFSVPNSIFPSPTSVPGGSPLLSVSFGVSGGTPVRAPLPEVTIGALTWSLYNLDVTTYRNGDPIPEVTDPVVWSTLTTGAWCYYNNDPANGPIYGKLYNQYAVSDPRGLAPIGWHVPSSSEWTYLQAYLEPGADEKLKEGGTAHWNAPNPATNSSGFTALGASNRDYNGTFGVIFLPLGDFTSFWTSTLGEFFSIYGTSYGGGTTIDGGYGGELGFSVRLVADY